MILLLLISLIALKNLIQAKHFLVETEVKNKALKEELGSLGEDLFCFSFGFLIIWLSSPNFYLHSKFFLDFPPEVLIAFQVFWNKLPNFSDKLS